MGLRTLNTFILMLNPKLCIHIYLSTETIKMKLEVVVKIVIASLLLYKYKNLYEDVGMAMPNTIETRCSYGSMQARQG